MPSPLKWTEGFTASRFDLGELEADLIGIYLGKDFHQNPVCIHTDIFEISILYRKFKLTKLNLADKQYQIA